MTVEDATDLPWDLEIRSRLHAALTDTIIEVFAAASKDSQNVLIEAAPVTDVLVQIIAFLQHRAPQMETQDGAVEFANGLARILVERIGQMRADGAMEQAGIDVVVRPRVMN